MRRSVLIAAAGLLALVAVPAAAAIPVGSGTTTPVRVVPRAGGPHTRFVFSLRIPAQTGVQGGFRRFDTLSVSGPRRRRCISAGSAALPAARAGARVRVTLNPARLGQGGWCRGTFTGEVLQSQRIICLPPPVYACPQLVIAPQVIARFRFRVR